MFIVKHLFKAEMLDLRQHFNIRVELNGDVGIHWSHIYRPVNTRVQSFILYSGQSSYSIKKFVLNRPNDSSPHLEVIDYQGKSIAALRPGTHMTYTMETPDHIFEFEEWKLVN